MPRARNPRVVAHEMIRELRRIATYVAAGWGGPRKSVVRDADRRNARWVIAPPEDQPENRVEDWEALRSEIARATQNLERLDAHAWEQLRRLRGAR